MKAWLKGLLIGLGIGLVLFVINLFTLGLFGYYIIISPILFIYSNLTGNYSLISDLSGCSGEGCWGVWIMFGGLIIFLISLSLGLFIGIYSKLKGVIITLIIFLLLITVILIPLGISDYRENFNLGEENILKFRNDIKILDSEIISISNQPINSEIIIKAPNNLIIIDEISEIIVMNWREPFDKKILNNDNLDGIFINEIDDGVSFSKDYSDKFDFIFYDESIENSEGTASIRVNNEEKIQMINRCLKIINKGINSEGKTKIAFDIIAKTDAC